MKKKPFYGWNITGLAFLILFVYQIHYTFGVFLEPLESEFGWSRTSISLAYSIISGLMIVAGVAWGKFLDAHGPRKLFAITFSLAGAGLFLTSFVSQLWQFYVAYGILWGIGWGAFLNTPQAIVRRWFVKRAGLALGLAQTGVALGWVALLPLARALIDSVGWQHTFQLLGGMVWIVGIIVVILVKPSPESIGALPDGEIAENTIPLEQNSANNGWKASEALKTRAFWTTWLAFFCIFASLNMVVTHGIAYATAQGIPREQVVFVFSIMGLISISGRIGAGWLGDHLIQRGRPPVHARRSMIRFSALFMGIGIILLMQADSLLYLWLWAILFGVGYGSHVPQVAAITGDLFGMKNMGLMVSLMFTAFGVAGMLISVWTGWIYDTTGNYTLAYQVGTALCFLSVILSSLITIPKRQALSE